MSELAMFEPAVSQERAQALEGLTFTCSKAVLSEAIGNVSRGVAAKSTIPSLEGIKMLLEGGTLHLTGYDLELGIQTEIPVTSSGQSGEFVVNARLFSEIIRKMPEDSITVELGAHMSTRISSGAAEYSIVSLTSEEYPAIPDFDKSAQISLPQPLLKNMIGQTLFAVAVTENKPILTGELFDVADGTFHLVAIDGFRLAVRQETVQGAENCHFVVPAKALKEISNLLRDEEEKTVLVSPGKKHISFEIGSYQVISRLLEGDFHNYKGSIPASSATQAVIGTREFIQSLDRCTLLINDKMKAPVKCLFSQGKLTMTCSTGLGRFHDEFPIDLTGPDVEIGFNCRYLLDALKASESDQVRLGMNGGLSPMKITPLEGEAYTFLVLPVRLKAE